MLLASPVVVEMNDIQDADEKAILAAFLLDRIRAHAKSRGSAGGRLRHVTVIEEAHRLLAKSNLAASDAASGDRARADSVRAFCEAVAELRALGEGFILSSQSPSTLAEAAVTSTGTRILHRLQSAVDRTAMLDDLDVSEQVRTIAARLHKGEVVARWQQIDEAEVIKVEAEGVDSARQVSDEAISDHMQQYRREVAHLLPYQLCAADICPDGCESKVRRLGGEIAESVAGMAAEAWTQTGSQGIDPVTLIASALATESSCDMRRAYCGAVHLSIQDIALRARPGRDERSIIRDAIGRAVQHGND
jgi:hypothetical protein